MSDITWTNGIDQKTGKPVDYDPNKDIQTYAGVANYDKRNTPLKKVCPSQGAENNYFPSSYSPRTKLIYIPATSNCANRADRPRAAQQGEGLERRPVKLGRSMGKQLDGRRSGDRRDQEEHPPELSELQRNAGDRRRSRLQRALLDGTIGAYDDTTLDALWTINVASGISAPPMTFAVNGKQYVAIVSGASPQSLTRLVNTPELKDQRNGLVLYVFGL